VCAALLLTAASGQAADPAGGKICAEVEITSKKIKGKLKVPPGATCTLFGDTIGGEVSVGQGARFTAIATLIKGKLSTEGAETVDLNRSEVGGNASFDATTGTSTLACFGGGIGDSVCLSPANKFFGDVSITNTSPGEAVFADNFVEHDLTCSGNALVTNDGLMNTVLGQEFGQCVGL
jgi:PPE-repeat protein